MELRECCICLDSTRMILKKLNCEDKHNITFLTMLNAIAPEQKWLEGFSICIECELQLDNAYYFKKLCLKNEGLRIKCSQQSEKEVQTNECVYSENDLGAETLSIKADEDAPEDFKEEDTPEDCNEENKSTGSKTLTKKIRKCFHCNKKFESTLTLEQHIINQHSHNCRLCSEIFITKKDLKIHIRNDHSDINSKSTKFQCEVCGEYFSLLKNILEHCSIVHSMDPKDVKPYRCSQCKNKFSSSTLLKQHEKYHDGDRTYVCSICGKSFITKRDLSGHEKLHDNQRKYACDKCNKNFNTSQNLKTHIYVVHTDPSLWKYACPVCLKRIAMKANFNEHVKRHQGNKDFLCHICKKTFVSKHEVKKHIKLHSNIAPYKCTECQRTYRDKRSLDLHLSRTHGIGIVKMPAKVKKFVCHVCPSQFFDNYKLQRHIRTHMGVKPYACHGCDKRFVDKSYLSHHLKSVHNIMTSTVKIEKFDLNFEDNL